MMSVPAHTAIVNPWVFGDAGQTGSPDSLPDLTKVNNVNVSAFIEIQSPNHGLGFLNSRLTTAQIDAMIVVNGMQAYNTTLSTLQAYINGGWANLLNSEANIVFPTFLPATLSSLNVATNGAVSYNSYPTLSVSGNLTAAQMTNLNTASVQVLAAPGAGFQYLVTGVYYEVLSTGHTAFATGGTVAVQYGTGGANTNYASSTTTAAFFQNATNFTIYTLGNINGTTGLASTTVANAALALGASANFTNGAGSSVNYIIYYQIIPVT
jgi:hypothetical protein